MKLDEVVTEQLTPFMIGGRRNVSIEGPAVSLAARAALSLGMAIHELATNAAKYGALSMPEGSVAMTWDIQPADSGDTLVLEWVERDGPPVQAPTQRGFGTALIERSLAHDLAGEAQIEFLPSGVRASVRARLDALISDNAPGAERITT